MAGNYVRTEKHRRDSAARMSKTFRGQPKSEITRERMSQAAVGRPKDPQHRANMRRAQRRYNELIKFIMDNHAVSRKTAQAMFREQRSAANGRSGDK